MRLFFVIIIGILFTASSMAQCVTYRLTDRGDTLNCTYKDGKKQGKWVVHVDPLRGEPGFEEEGEYKNDAKEGKWRQYDLNGLLIGIENYRWGKKDLVQQYYVNGELEHEESWHAIDPEKKFDTVDVPDLYDRYKVERVIVKVDASTVKHGIWKYYRPGSLSVIRTETYMLGKLQIPVSQTIAGNAKDSTKTLPKKETKPAAVLEFERKNKGKKNIKFKDGSVGF